MAKIILFFIAALSVLPVMSQVAECDNAGGKNPEKVMNRTVRELSPMHSSSMSDHEKNNFLKSATGNMQQPDSSITDTYDNSKDEWVHSYRTTYDYDKNGNLILDAYYKWIDSQNLWAKDSKREYTYNEKSYMWITYEADSSDSLVFYSKWNEKYDQNGYRSESLSSFWDISSGKWIFDYKDEYVNNDQGKILSDTAYNWNINTSQWDPSYLLDESYDSAGHRTQYLESEWNSDSSKWVFYQNYEYNYNIEGQNTLETHYLEKGLW